jgi:hypothetical protein
MKLSYMVTYKVRTNSIVFGVIVMKVKVTAAKNRLKMCWNFQIGSFPDFSLPLIQILCWFLVRWCMLMWYRTSYEFCSCWPFFEYCLLIGKHLDIVRFHSNLVHTCTCIRELQTQPHKFCLTWQWNLYSWVCSTLIHVRTILELNWPLSKFWPISSQYSFTHCCYGNETYVAEFAVL